MKKSALPQPSGNEKRERTMELTKENLESMLAKNTEAISVYTEIMEGKISTLNTYNNGISDIMSDYPNLQKTHIQEDSEALRDLLVVICHNDLEGSLEAVQGKINEMLGTVSSIKPPSDWAEDYLNQYWRFLYDLRDLITELPLYRASNLAISRKLREFSGPAEIAQF